MVSTSMRSPPELAAIFEDHFDDVWNTLRHLGVPESDREDLVHDVFLNIHARLHEYDATRPLRAWVLRSAYHVATDHHRLARDQVEVLGTSSDTWADNLPADECVAALEEREMLIQSLHLLESTRREVLMMYYVEEIPVARIAYILDIPVDTTYSRLRLAREQLANVVVGIRIARGVL
jgi:RNA polymerase sigma-70 factor (ECF subfamily)